MPRTLYSNNAVSPDVHRLRALGGPLYNALGLLLSVAIYKVLPRNSIAREVAGWLALGHGFLASASMAPVPMVDGGTLLKWTLVTHGKTTTEADRVIRKADWALGTAAAAMGVGFVTRRAWLPGLGLMVIGAVVLGIAADKIH
jgi:hypothetical protein